MVDFIAGIFKFIRVILAVFVGIFAIPAMLVSGAIVVTGFALTAHGFLISIFLFGLFFALFCGSVAMCSEHPYFGLVFTIFFSYCGLVTLIGACFGSFFI